MRAKTAFLALLLAPALAQAGFKSVWPVDGRIGAVNSASPNRNNEDNLKSGGPEIDLHFAPILGWTQSRFLILPALDLAYVGTNEVLKVDDERFEFIQQLTSRGELGVAFKRTPDQRFGGRVFVEGFQAKQAVNEELFFGQYNYQDSGLGADWRQKWSLIRTTLGVTATDRRYPHWQSLDDTKRSEKDEAIAKGFVDLEWPWSAGGGVTKFGLSYMNKGYYSGVTVDETGTTVNAVRRRDGVINANLSVPMRFGGSDIDIDLGVQSWDSNLNHYETQSGTYIPDYNDFVDVSGGIGYAYGFRRPWWVLKSPQLSLDIDLELRQYGQRLAKKADGSFQDAKQRDFTRRVTLGFNSSVTEHWAFYVKAGQLSAASNNEDSSSALYNYTLNNFSLGVNFAY